VKVKTLPVRQAGLSAGEAVQAGKVKEGTEFIILLPIKII